MNFPAKNIWTVVATNSRATPTNVTASPPVMVHLRPILSPIMPATAAPRAALSIVSHSHTSKSDGWDVRRKGSTTEDSLPVGVNHIVAVELVAKVFAELGNAEYNKSSILIE